MSTIAQYLPSLEKSIRKTAKYFFDANQKTRAKLNELIKTLPQEVDIICDDFANLPWSMQMDVNLQAYKLGDYRWQGFYKWFSTNPKHQKNKLETHDEMGLINLQIGKPSWFARLIRNTDYYPIKITFLVFKKDSSTTLVTRKIVYLNDY